MIELLMRVFSTSAKTLPAKHKVAVLGAAGGIGQPLSLLLKLAPNSVKHLALYDIANVGMAADLAHIDTAVTVSAHSGEEELANALNGASIVLMPAGVPRKPGMTRDDLFNINAGIVKKLASAVAKNCPNAHLLVISNPVNSTVPIAYETMKALGVSKPSVVGVTTLDIVRARTFVSESLKLNPSELDVKVVGGHSGPTIVPFLSHWKFDQKTAEEITKRIQYGGDEVVKAKAGGGSATLSMAHAAKQFFDGFVEGLAFGAEKLIGFVKKDTAPGGEFIPTDYMAVEIEVNDKGVSRILPLPKMNSFEEELYKVAVRDLANDIKRGQEFAAKP
jgi:malate dehydrogenase